MPTPVSAARQCLTEEAARALDDAVAVARRRSHMQTTSLHVVSALLSLSPTSPLREACLRALTATCSPRLQLRALELSVGVSLDRLSTSKSSADAPPPPVNNSLMAAIKRSQANQRRHPDTWQLYQQLQSPSQSANSTIRVEMKHFILSILDDPAVSRVLGEAGFRSSDIKLSVLHPSPVSKFPIYSHLFRANSPNSDPSRVRFSFPFAGFNSLEENCRKIGEILVKRKGNKRNPLLIGNFANEALASFTKSVKTGETGLSELQGVSVICLEKEGLEVKFKELRGILGSSSGGGVLVSVGDFKGLIGDVVGEMSELMEAYGERLWVVGAVMSYDMYMKILGEFPTLEKDWDLQLLPISSSPASGGLPSKSSLIGSFVPLGGFFPSPSESSSQLSYTTQSAHCGVCHEKYENEVSATLRGGSGASNSNDYSAKDDRTILDTKMAVLKKKCDDNCCRLHSTKPLSLDIPKTVSQFIGNPHLATISRQNSGDDSSSAGNAYPCLITSSPLDIQKAIVPKPTLSYPMISEVSEVTSIVENHQTSRSSITSVTTDLGLGDVSAKPDGFGKNGSNCVFSPQMDVRDFKSMYRLLSEKVGRQDEAISTICQAISQCKVGLGRPRALSRRGDIWLNFIGHDRIGKKRVAQALSEIIFGLKGNVMAVDLGSENGVRCSSSIFRGQNANNYDGKFRGKTGIDRVVNELIKNPHSVVLLENIDKADCLAQNNLLQAIKTGRFANSHGREISFNNAIFVTTSDISRMRNESIYKKDFVRFSEERILEAKSWQMQILVRHVVDYTQKTNGMNVLIVGRKESSITNKRKLIDMNESIIDKPKRAHQGSDFVLDLNLPVEEGADIEDGISESDTESESSRAWLEEFFDQVDENVVFQPFDFDALSNEVLRDIDRKFKMTVGSDVVLEIEDEVVVQLIAAAWLLEKKAVENWVEHVLGQSFVDAKKWCNSRNGQVIMKLVSCEGVYGKEQHLGVCLPSRITVK